MRSNKKIFVWTLLVALLFFIAGMTAFTRLLQLLEPNIEGIAFVITGRLTAFLFSLTLALIPVLTLATWRLAHIDLFYRKICSVTIIILTIAAALFTRHQQVKAFFNKVVRPLVLTKGETHFVYPIDPRNFVYYLLAGLLIGCLLSYLLLRQKSKMA